MSNDHLIEERRRFLTLVGGGAVMLPFAGLAACSSEEQAAPGVAARVKDAYATRPDPATADSGKTAAPEAAGEASSGSEQMAQNDAGSGGLPRLSEDSAQANSFGYKHVASDVDQSKQPRYKDGQKCSNCQLYQAKASDAWGPCPIFAGKAVKATGWCTAYVPISA
jgi:hypothetical protein